MMHIVQRLCACGRLEAGVQVLLDVAESVRCGTVSCRHVLDGLAIRIGHHRSCCCPLSVRLLPQERYSTVVAVVVDFRHANDVGQFRCITLDVGFLEMV